MVSYGINHLNIVSMPQNIERTLTSILAHSTKAYATLVFGLRTHYLPSIHKVAYPDDSAATSCFFWMPTEESPAKWLGFLHLLSTNFKSFKATDFNIFSQCCNRVGQHRLNGSIRVFNKRLL